MIAYYFIFSKSMRFWVYYCFCKKLNAMNLRVLSIYGHVQFTNTRLYLPGLLSKRQLFFFPVCWQKLYEKHSVAFKTNVFIPIICMYFLSTMDTVYYAIENDWKTNTVYIGQCFRIMSAKYHVCC